ALARSAAAAPRRAAGAGISLGCSIARDARVPGPDEARSSLGSDATHRSRAAARGAGGNALMLKLARDPRPFVPAKAGTQFLMDSRFRGNERSMRTQRKLKTAGGAFTLHQTPLTSPHHTHHRRPCPMTISMYKSSVPIFVQFLTSLS